MDDDEYRVREANLRELRQVKRQLEGSRLPKVEDDDNDSIWSLTGLSDEADELLSPNSLPVRPLGLSRRTGFTNYDDYDVITVHGARDDPRTAWTSPHDNSNWILDHLFKGQLVRQLDYVYDTSDTARIYDPNADGIAIEANALLHSLAQNRIELPTTEDDRPIVWICHDLGGSIVKQALVNATYKLPDIPPDDLEDVEYTMDFRRMYRRLPLLTSSIIFLGCPHNAKANEDLVDQLFAMMLLPGPIFKTQAMNKIRNIARQIETGNHEFLESKMSDRALIINVFTRAPRRKASSTSAELHKGLHSVGDETASRQEADHPFSSYIGHMFPNLGTYTTICLKTMDHLGLVRGSWPEHVAKEGFDWVEYFSIRFNTCGYTVKNHASLLAFQNSLLSVSPPTQVITHTHQFLAEDGLTPCISQIAKWITEHEFFETRDRPDLKPQILYVHAGKEGHHDVKFVSRQLCFVYDMIKKGPQNGLPNHGCFYFEFDRHDSRRSGIRAMFSSLICTLACRFWMFEPEVVRMCVEYFSRHQSWTRVDLVNLFVMVQERCQNVRMTIILAQGDHLDKWEEDELFKAIFGLGERSENPIRFIITTTRAHEAFCEKIGSQNVINLDDFSLAPGEVVYPDDASTAESTTERALQMPPQARRPRSTQMAPKFNRMLKRLGKSTASQDKASEETPNSRAAAPIHRPTGSLQDPSPGTHQKLLRGLLEPLTEPTQTLMRRVCSWIRHAAEPLTPEMLTEAMQSSLPQEMQTLGMNQSTQEFVKSVQKTMRGIIILEGRDLRFSDDGFYDVSGSSMFQVEDNQTNRAHADMATVCLRYLLGNEGQLMLRSLSVENHGLNDQDLKWSPIMLPRQGIGAYALRFWAFHYRAAGSYRPADLAWELFQDESKLRVWTEAVYVVSNPFNRIQREYISPLPYMAMYGLEDLVRRHIQNEGKQSGLNQDHWLAIVEAARNEHRKTVLLLVKHADRNMAGLAEAIDWAASSDYPNALEAALDILCLEAQKIKGFCWPPFILNRAVAGSHDTTLMAALLKTGYDPNERDSTGKATAVHTAIMLGRFLMLETLLKSGRVDIKLKGRYYGTSMPDGFSPRAGAIITGRPGLAHLLYKLGGAALNDDREIWHCLIEAARHGSHGSIAYLLRSLKVSPLCLTHCLYNAARRGFAQCVRIFLDKGADPNHLFGDHSSALSVAIASGANGTSASLEVCRMLLQQGADPNKLTADFMGRRGIFKMCRAPPTLLILAIGLKNMPLVSMLLDHRAKIDGVDPGAGTDLPLSVALMRKDMEIADLLLKRGANPNLGYADGWLPGAMPPLLVACNFCPEPSHVEKLITSGAKVRGIVAVDGISVLHSIATSDRMLRVLPLLLAHGAEINATDDSSYTPLMVAATCGSTEIAKFLLKQTDPKPDLEVTSTKDPSRTALHLALRDGYPGMVKLLLEAGANVDRQMSNGQFPLGQLLASDKLQQDREDLFEFMLKWKPDLSLADNEGNTVLHNVRPDTPLPVVVRLVVEGAPVNTSNELGYSPLACAVRCGNTNVARYLTTVRGVQSDVHHANFGSILHLAAAHSTLDVVKQLIRTGAEHSVVNPAFGESILYSTVGHEKKKELRKIIRYFVEEVGVDVNAPGGRWVCSLLRTVVESKGNHLLKYLLNYGARTDYVDFLGRAAVHWAVMKRRLIDLETLVEYGADVSVLDKFGRSPLHFAASKDDLNILRHLLKKLPDGAANDNAADVDGWTPLMWAARSGSSMAFALIDEYQADTCARSHDAQWSPLRIARFCGWSEKEIEGLKQRAGAQGREEGCLSEDDETKPGERYEQICVGCDMACIGQLWSCTNCETFLCFKCIGHSAKMHDPDHTFGEMEAQLEEEEELGEDVDEIEHEGGSQTGNDGEVQEETESEIETESEEEDTESEDEDDDDRD